MSRFAFCIALATLFASPALAHEEHEHVQQEEVRHMEVETPATGAEARAMLTEHWANMQEAWNKKDYGTVHVESYYLEAAVGRLEEDAAEADNDEKLAELSELQTAIYKVHHAAEDETLSKVEAGINQLQKLIPQALQ